VIKYSASKQSKFQYASEEESLERTHREDPWVERTQALILKDPRQLLRKLTSIVGVSEPTMRRIAEEGHMQHFSAGWCTGSHKPFGPKLALR